MSKTTPDHYGGAEHPYEAIKVIEAWGLGFCLGNAVKYLCRAGKKQGESACDDLEKAAWYVDREIKAKGGESVVEALAPLKAWREGYERLQRQLSSREGELGAANEEARLCLKTLAKINVEAATPSQGARIVVGKIHEALAKHLEIVAAKDAELLSAQNELALYREALGKPTPSPVSATFTPSTMVEPPTKREEIAGQPPFDHACKARGWDPAALTPAQHAEVMNFLDPSATYSAVAGGVVVSPNPAGSDVTINLPPRPVTDEERRTVETAKALSKALVETRTGFAYATVEELIEHMQKIRSKANDAEQLRASRLRRREEFRALHRILNEEAVPSGPLRGRVGWLVRRLAEAGAEAQGG